MVESGQRRSKTREYGYREHVAGDGQGRSHRSHLRAFRAASPDGPAARASQGLVVIPVNTATSDQRARYAAYVEACTPRTRSPQGPGRLLFARNLLGSAEEIAAQLRRHAGYREVTEIVFTLPFGLVPDDHTQILTDTATRLGPALGWSPGVSD